MAESWGWGGDGAGRGGAGRKEPGDARMAGATAGQPAHHAKGHGLHSKAKGTYCLGGVSDLPLAWVTELWVLDYLLVCPRHCEYVENQLLTNTRGSFSQEVHWVLKHE